jgi:pimeloyl-ACP methyl ester carboxylesterase
VLPERVTHVTLLAGLGPLDRPGALRGMHRGRRRAIIVARHLPALADAVTRIRFAQERRRPAALARRTVRTLPRCDWDIATHLAVQASLTDSWERAQGVEGQLLDWAVVGTPWEFDPATITAPVHLWQGSDDNRVPLHHAQHLADRIPGARLTVLPAGGPHDHLQSDRGSPQ